MKTPLDISEMEKLSLRVKANGEVKRYKVILDDEQSFQSQGSYESIFQASLHFCCLF